MVRVPICMQSDGFCGPSSFRMCLKYYGIEESEENLARLIGVNPRYGCGGERIIPVAKQFGFSGSFFQDECSVNQLREYCKEYPVIVNWTLPLFDNGSFCLEGHYSVAMELSKRRIYLADPLMDKERIFDIGNFVRLWYDHIGLHPHKQSDFIVRRAIVIKK